MDRINHQGNNELQDFLTDMVLRIEDVLRWKRYPHDYRQTVLQHTLETALLTQIVVAIERAVGNQFDAYLLLSAAVDHDLGEGIIGDIAYDIKNDPRVKDQIEVIEKEQFEVMFLKLDLGEYSTAVVETFKRSFAVQEEQDSVEGALFNAIEKIGYVIFALREIDADNDIFIRVLKNHQADLLKYSEKFQSIKLIFDKCLEHMRRIPTTLMLRHGFPLKLLNNEVNVH
ncbi:MAG: YfbR-like 5'-deoxynucleotidase [Patescibacteria group bacterium]